MCTPAVRTSRWLWCLLASTAEQLHGGALTRHVWLWSPERADSLASPLCSPCCPFSVARPCQDRAWAAARANGTQGPGFRSSFWVWDVTNEITYLTFVRPRAEKVEEALKMFLLK